MPQGRNADAFGRGISWKKIGQTAELQQMDTTKVFRTQELDGTGKDRIQWRI